MKNCHTLYDLCPGDSGIVCCLIVSGSMRRRFLDIGLIENTLVICVGQSPSRDPKAFLIRGAVIAIRKEDCECIIINQKESENE